MHEQMLAMQAALGRGAASPEGILEGVVVTGSWNPAEGTIEVQIGDTAAVLTDLGDSPVTIQATVLTPALGEQYGPIGGERCLLFRTQSGYSALIEHGPDDTPKAPAGEHWRILYDHKQYPTAFVVIAYDKITNDGKNAGDDKGGRRILVGSYGTIATTGGHLISIDDTGEAVTVESAGGGSIVINDVTGQITFTYGGATMLLDSNTGTIQMQGSGDSSLDGIVRLSDLQTAMNNVVAAVQTWAEGYIKSTATGSGWTGPSPIPPTATASAKSLTG